MSKLDLTIADKALDDLTSADISAHIAAIRGDAKPRKIESKSAGLRTLRKLRQWSENLDGLLGVSKGEKPQVRSYDALAAKARSRGVAMPAAGEIPDLPAAAFVPEDDVPEIMPESAPGNPEIEVIANKNPEPVKREAAREPSDPKGEEAEGEKVEDAPEPVAPSANIETESARKYPRGSLRAQLAEQLAKAAPIVPKARKDVRPKKVTGEARKPREALLGVRATFAGITKNHAQSDRAAILLFIQTKATREIPGWPKGAVPMAELEKHFEFGKSPKPFVHKLLEDRHLERVVPLVPGEPG